MDYMGAIRADARKARLVTGEEVSQFGERTRPRVPSATPSSLTSPDGFSKGDEPRTRGLARNWIEWPLDRAGLMCEYGLPYYEDND
jgi:hypothetical protein